MSGTCQVCGHDMCVCNSQPTGGQPAPESVVEAHEETMTRADKIDRHIMSQPWRFGALGRSIVCDPLSNSNSAEERWDIVWYGGICVLEGCPSAVREHIIRLHNESLPKFNVTI